MIPRSFYKIICLSIIISIVDACNSPDPVKISEVEGSNFVQCNIDKIKNVRNLKLSEISESCEIVFLEDSEALEPEDYQLGYVTVSDNFIVVMPEQRPALLYSRDGIFIKRLGGSGAQKYLWAINSLIDKQEDKVYIQVPGFEQLFVFGLKDSSFSRIEWAIKPTYDFAFSDSTTLFGVINDKENWGYLQSVNVPVAKLIQARYVNSLHPYFSSIYRMLRDGNKVVLDFYQDTTYYFNSCEKTFTPFLHCYSEENAVTSIRVLENISNYGVDFEKITDGKPFRYKHLIYAANGYYIFKLTMLNHSEKQFLAIDTNRSTAFFIDNLINDFYGNTEIDIKNAMTANYRVNNKDGYFTFHLNTTQFKEEINKFDNNTVTGATRNEIIQLSEKLENKKGFSNILFLNKLRE